MNRIGVCVGCGLRDHSKLYNRYETVESGRIQYHLTFTLMRCECCMLKHLNVSKMDPQFYTFVPDNIAGGKVIISDFYRDRLSISSIPFSLDSREPKIDWNLIKYT